jgi:hypothetical protein
MSPSAIAAIRDLEKGIIYMSIIGGAARLTPLKVPAIILPSSSNLSRTKRTRSFQGHTIFKEGPLEKIVATGLKRKVRRRESIDIGACECGG